MEWSSTIRVKKKPFWNFLRHLQWKNILIDEQRIGILGMTPQDVSDLDCRQIKYGICFSKNTDRKQSVTVWEMDLQEVKKSSSVSRNIVVSPAALATAKYLEKTFGTPYEIYYPLVEDLTSGDGLYG